MTVRKNHHYLPRLYLRQFAENGCVQIYRLLVSHANVPPWKGSQISGVASRDHLYNRARDGKIVDDLERWFEREFETPAAAALRKAASDARLTSAEWSAIARFAVLQDLRTPARMLELLERQEVFLRDNIEKLLTDSVTALEKMLDSEEEISVEPHPSDAWAPIRVERGIDEAGRAVLGARVILGRASWLYMIRHFLAGPARVAHKHRWTIRKMPPEKPLFTSDHPVVRLNYYGPGRYDFLGGWDNDGTEIFMPISPSRLLYTQVGSRSPPRGEVMSDGEAELIRQLVAEHAHRLIIAKEKIPEVERYRPRTVDIHAYKAEEEAWRAWSEVQSSAEHRFDASRED